VLFSAIASVVPVNNGSKHRLQASLSNADLDAGINEAIRIIGESIDVDRVEVFQLVDNSTGEGLGSMRGFMNGIHPMLVHSFRIQS